MAWTLLALLLLPGLLGCESERAKTTPATAPAAHPQSAPAQPQASRRGSEAKHLTSAEKPEAQESLDAAAPAANYEATQESKLFIIDELIDVAPAGPASATSKGIVMVTRDREVLLAKLGRLSQSAAPARSPILELDVESQRLAMLGRGPAIVEPHAYWISEGELVRAPFRGGKLETLATDARSYTRVAAPSPAKKKPRAVAYIAKHPSDPNHLLARLWVEGHGSTTLSPDGAGASSVAIAALGDRWLALTLEGRTGMSPLHARAIRFPRGAPRLSSDVVVWVGGTAQPLTEVVALGVAEEAWTFVAVERSVTLFGLATIHVDQAPLSESRVEWQNYPNGIDPAPAATATLCGKPALLFVRPSSAKPRSPQELHVATIDAGKLGPSTLIARGRAFSDISVASIRGGALISYGADRETWGLTLRCRQ